VLKLFYWTKLLEMEIWKKLMVTFALNEDYPRSTRTKISLEASIACREMNIVTAID
jgi:hypothetical protein